MFSSKYYGYTHTMISIVPNYIESMISEHRLDRTTFIIPTIITRIPMNYVYSINVGCMYLGGNV